MAWCWRSPALSSDSRRGRALSSCLKLFFFKQKTAYEIDCDWSSDVCSSDLVALAPLDDLRVAGGDRHARGVGCGAHSGDDLAEPVELEALLQNEGGRQRQRARARDREV